MAKDPANNQTILYLPRGEQLTLNTGNNTVTGVRYYTESTDVIVVVRSWLGTLYYEGETSQGTATLEVDASTLAYSFRYFDPYGNLRGTPPGSWADQHSYLGQPRDRPPDWTCSVPVSTSRPPKKTDPQPFYAIGSGCYSIVGTRNLNGTWTVSLTHHQPLSVPGRSELRARHRRRDAPARPGGLGSGIPVRGESFLTYSQDGTQLLSTSAPPNLNDWADVPPGYSDDNIEAHDDNGVWCTDGGDYEDGVYTEGTGSTEDGVYQYPAGEW